MKVLSKTDKVTEVKGNLITIAKDGKVDIIVHGCNCFATMGAGIALYIASAFPEAKRADKQFKAAPKDRLGKYTKAVVKVKGDKELTILNAYTQYQPGPDFRKSALEEFLQSIIHDFAEVASWENQKTIAFPKIGCGIGGGNWDMVKPVIVNYLSRYFNIMFVYFD